MLARLSHPIIALVIATAFFAMGAHPLVAALAGILPLIWREVAQAEERAIRQKYGVRAYMPWWKGWDVRLWTMHSIRDVAVAALVVTLAALTVMLT
ncbi:hypothetical protein [Sphingomonas sp.]|uniref:hypothetical protein n=1 Tax=Sphingomonas sp. TaxID=28214 RepID=UPI0035A8A5A5